MPPLELNTDGRLSLHGRTPKVYVRGTHRTVPPAETLARLKPLLPKMGITRLANVTGLDTIGIPVVMSVRPRLAVAVGLPGQGARPRFGESVGGDGVDRGLPRRARHGSARARELRRAARRRTSWSIPLRLPLSRPTVLSDHPAAAVDCGRRLAPSRDRSGCRFSSCTPPTPRACAGTSWASPPRARGWRRATIVLEAVSHALCEIVERDATCALPGAARRGAGGAPARSADGRRCGLPRACSSATATRASTWRSGT